MKRLDRKSDCAINFSLESLGDAWSLLIVRDIVFFGKKTYGEFLGSDERIGTSVLARRLKELEAQGILARRGSPADARRELYSLTPKGLDLIPLLFALTEWGARHDPATGARREWIRAIQRDREGILARTRQAVQRGGSVRECYREIIGTARRGRE